MVQYIFKKEGDILLYNGASLLPVYKIASNSSENNITIHNVYNNKDVLFRGAKLSEIEINSVVYTSFSEFCKEVNPLLFIKGRADGSNGGSEDSTLQQITTNGNTTDKELVIQGATLGADENGNLKLGKSALSKLADIGLNLTAIGVNALALYDGSQGSYKESIVALGNTAGANLKGGGYAVIIGPQAAASLITTFVDVIIGSDAAKRATTSNGYNVAIGHGVAQKATILTDETIIGGTAMNKYMGEPYKTTNDPTGETELQSGGNISIGKWSLYSMLYGRENIAIGNECGRYFLNYGEYNIFLGPGITKDYRQVYGNSSVVIGAYAPIPENFNLSYKLIVHARRPEDPWVFPLIYGDFKERWLKLSGNLILPPPYTPDADKEPAEGEEAFVPYKMLVVDAEGKVGVKKLETSPTETNSIQRFGLPINKEINLKQEAVDGYVLFDISEAGIEDITNMLVQVSVAKIEQEDNATATITMVSNTHIGVNVKSDSNNVSNTVFLTVKA